MPRRYTHADLLKAVKAVENGMCLRDAEKTFHVPRNTIHRRVRGKVALENQRGGPAPILGDTVEEQLRDAVIGMQKNGYSLRRKEICDLASHLAHRAGNEGKFPGGRAGRKWFENFKKRQNVSLVRKSENISVPTEETDTLIDGESDLEAFFDSFTSDIPAWNADPLDFDTDKYQLELELPIEDLEGISDTYMNSPMSSWGFEELDGLGWTSMELKTRELSIWETCNIVDKNDEIKKEKGLKIKLKKNKIGNAI